MSSEKWPNQTFQPPFGTGSGTTSTSTGAGLFASTSSASGVGSSVFGSFTSQSSSISNANKHVPPAASAAMFGIPGQNSVGNANNTMQFGAMRASSIFQGFPSSNSGTLHSANTGQESGAKEQSTVFGSFDKTPMPSEGASQPFSIFGNIGTFAAAPSRNDGPKLSGFPTGDSVFGSFKSTTSAPLKTPVFVTVGQEQQTVSTGQTEGKLDRSSRLNFFGKTPMNKDQSQSLFGQSMRAPSATDSSQSSIFDVKSQERRRLGSNESTTEMRDTVSPLAFRPLSEGEEGPTTSRNIASGAYTVTTRRKRSFDEDGAMQNPQISSSNDDYGGASKKRSLPGSQSLRSMLTDSDKNISPHRTEDPSEPGHSKVVRRTAIQHTGSNRLRKLSSSALLVEHAAALMTSSAIICHDVPPEMNNRRSLQEHFARFGDITRITVNEEKGMATIVFKTHEIAAAAKMEGAYINESDSAMKIFFKRLQKPTERSPVNRTESTEPGQPHRAVSRVKVHPRQLGGPRARLPVRSHQTPAIYARSDEDKLNLLEKIDSILRKKVVRQSDIKKAKIRKGTCPDMCPEKERYLRQQRKLLSVYEMNGGNVDHSKAIKEYSRSSADQEEPLPHDLRPASVLRMAMHYLLSKMMPKLSEGQIADWYDFVWNRTRAMRKELTIQQISDVEGIHINEQCARFHIFCAHRLCGEDRMVFSPKINNENLEKTMKTIMDLYQEVYFAPSTSGGGVSLENSNVAELYGYYIMLNINRTADVLNELQQLPPEIRMSSDIGIAVEAFMAVHSNNYVKFFKAVKCATFLQGCILHRYFTQVRRRATLTMAKAFVAPGRKYVPFPIMDFMRILCFNDESEIKTFCQHHGIAINEDNMIELNRSGFEEKDSALADSPSSLILGKVEGQSLAEIIAKCELNEEDHVPHSSFDENGRYIGEHAALLSSDNVPDTFQALQPLQQAEAPREAPSSILDMLPAGMTNIDVKIIAKELFHEIIDEMCLSVAKDMWEATVAGAIVKGIFEEVTTEDCLSIGVHAIEEATENEKKENEKKRIQEEERKRRELIEKEAQRQRELKELEEKREKERILMENEEMKLRQSEILACEMQLDVENEIIQSVAEEVHKELLTEHRIEKWSKEEQEDVIKSVVCDLSNEICVNTWKELKKEQCARIFTEFKKRQLRRHLNKWQREKTIKLKFQTLRKTFPTVPLSRRLNDQIKELLPNQRKFSMARKRNSFPLDSTAELSLRSPMNIISSRKRCKTFFDRAKPKMEKLCQYATMPLPFCDMLDEARQKEGFVQSSDQIPKTLYWKIALKLPFQDKDDVLCSWLRYAFLGAKDNFSMYGSEAEKPSNPDIGVCCRVLSEENLHRDIIGAHGLVLALPAPKFSSPIQQDLAAARAELEVLMSSRPPVPPVPLLIVLLDWEAEPDMLNELLGLSMLDFSFSRWTVCSFDDNAGAILENYQKLVAGVQFFFEKMPALPSLTSTTLREFFESTLTQEYVAPLCKHISQRREARMPPLEPGLQIQFFNFAVEALANATNSEDFGEISWPPSEFMKPGVKTDLPQQNWNSEETLSDNFDAMQKCKVPHFPEIPGVTTESGIMGTAVAYASSVSPKCPALISAVRQRVTVELQKLADEIPLTDNSLYLDEEEILRSFDWHSVIDCIISQHLTDILYQSELGNRVITYPADAISNVEKHPGVELLFSEADYFSLNEPPLEHKDFTRTHQSGIVEDMFTSLEYSLPPSFICDTTWTKEETEVSKAVKETENLHETLKRERELNSQCEDRLQDLLREGDLPLNIMDSTAMCNSLLSSDLPFVF